MINKSRIPQNMEFTSSEDADKCAICFENYKRAEVLPCGHKYCQEPCFKDLLKRSQGGSFKCPLCRQSYKARVPSVQRNAGADKGTHTTNKNTIVTISEKVQNEEESFKSSYGSMRILPAFKRDEINFKAFLSCLGEHGCFGCLVSFSIIVCCIHCVLIGLGRLTTGMIVLENTLEKDAALFDIALYQIVEGLLNIITITIFLFGNNIQRKLFPVCILATIICLTYGSTILWNIICNDTFVVVSRYYTIFDWIMVIYLIVFGYYTID